MNKESLGQAEIETAQAKATGVSCCSLTKLPGGIPAPSAWGVSDLACDGRNSLKLTPRAEAIGYQPNFGGLRVAII